MISVIEKIQSALDRNEQTSFRFLSPAELVQLPKSDALILDGGYPDAERKRVYINHDTDSFVTCFRIQPADKQMILRHQDILGSLMSLSITRDSIGDILPKQNVFFIISELHEEVLRSFTSIGHTPISLSIIDGSTIVSEQDYIYDECIAESLRLDLIVAKLTKQSRLFAQEMIQKEWIKINHKVEMKPTKQLKEDDILSIRQSGRFQILDTSKRTKKDKIVVKYRKFS